MTLPMNYIDISPIISESLAVFPGDQSFRLKKSYSIEKGDHIDLASFSGTLHLGSHADAPSHYIKGGKTIEQVNLEPYFGQCQVFHVNITKGERIQIKDFNLDGVIESRVLFRTNSFPDPNIWNDDFNSLSPELIKALKSKNVQLIGIDTPSADPADSKNLESHQALAATDIRILEGLDLSKVQEGTYQLVALPLALKGAEASPVRAILIS